MSDPGLIEILRAAITPPLAVLLLLSAAYSLIFCVKDAKTRNHPRAEKTARIGGWLYAALAALALTINLF